MRLVVDGVGQAQAAQEAVRVLKESGFYVGDYSVGTEVESSTFSLDLDLSVPKDERPVENIK